MPQIVNPVEDVQYVVFVDGRTKSHDRCFGSFTALEARRFADAVEDLGSTCQVMSLSVPGWWNVHVPEPIATGVRPPVVTTPGRLEPSTIKKVIE